MIKILRCCCFILVVFLGSCAKTTKDKTETATNDSIQKYLDLANDDTLAFDQRIKYNDKALSFIDLNKNDSLYREFLNIIVYNYLNTKKWDSYKKISKIYFQKSVDAKDTLGLARYYRYKGIYFKNFLKYDNAFYNYLKSEKLYLKTKDHYGLNKVYLNLAFIQYSVDDYLASELSTKKAYKYFKNSKETFETYQCLINLGNVYHDLKQYNKAISFLKQAQTLAVKYKIPDKPNSCLISSCLNNIGNAYREQKKYNIAIFYFKKALTKKRLFTKDPVLYSILLNNLGYCYLQLNQESKLPYLFYKSAKLLDSLNVKNECAVSYLYLSQFYFKKKDILNARIFAEKALKFSKEAKAPYYYLTALSNAGYINSQKASQYIKEYHEKNDSLIFSERNARNQYYKIQLETDEITQEKDKAIHQKWVIVNIAIFILLIVVLILIINHQRAKQKELQLYQSEQTANEKVYQLMLTQKTKEEEVRQKEKKRIGLELHDGIMNKLASARLNLSTLVNKNDTDAIQKYLAQIASIHQIEQEIRSIAHDMNTNIFQKSNSYIQLLQDLIMDKNNTCEINYELEVDKDIDWNSISSEVKMNLYRIIQEACYNIHKYSKAKNAIVSFTFDNNNICLSITDNGIGFKNGANLNGIGIQNMKYRVKALGGKFAINSSPNKSTSINIAIPV
ncbi:tetratricopeptide repeat-containing sensor histidine kinase [Flavobacterium sp.]|uniref:tetratricopeptide repeat-containing sensor histidine kinase n=1 Tax=Flavobacterium sp. TaxID=239 RepID=UPI002FDB4E1B